MTKTATATFTLCVQYDPNKTDPESLATALDRLMETALSTSGILDDYGEVSMEEFYVQERPKK